jgi:hypothetical protein
MLISHSSRRIKGLYRIKLSHPTTTLNLFVNFAYSYNFFQTNIPMYAETADTGIKIGIINFHTRCSKIVTLSNVIKSISKNVLNILTDHGK